MGPAKIMLLIVVDAVIIALTVLIHHKNRHMSKSPFVDGENKLAITVQNQQEGEDIGDGIGHVELLCNGYSEYNYSFAWWSSRAVLGSGERARFTLPEVKGDEAFEICCSYRGANGCWAHQVTVFSNPGHDDLFCEERHGGCTVRFRNDGGVEKQYDGYTKVQPPIFLGFVPDMDNARDRCISHPCIPRALDRVIGEESCCDSSCGGWEKAIPKNKVGSGI